MTDQEIIEALSAIAYEQSQSFSSVYIWAKSKITDTTGMQGPTYNGENND